ncbi:MAG: hypothetical protein IPN17_30725 [Deltaproteobacteria bacterium]|nr:hypothetical protein [Deltaproteobacteria bacterium]
MADLGAEFGIGAVDGAHEMPFTALAAAVQQATADATAPRAPTSAPR